MAHINGFQKSKFHITQSFFSAILSILEENLKKTLVFCIIHECLEYSLTFLQFINYYIVACYA